MLSFLALPFPFIRALGSCIAFLILLPLTLRECPALFTPVPVLLVFSALSLRLGIESDMFLVLFPVLALVVPEKLVFLPCVAVLADTQREVGGP
jgi:hypothetical protein